jgi:hypothetical protein
MPRLRYKSLDCGPGCAVDGALNLIEGKWKAPAPEPDLPFSGPSAWRYGRVRMTNTPVAPRARAQHPTGRNNAPKHRRNRYLRTLDRLAALLDCLRTEGRIMNITRAHWTAAIFAIAFASPGRAGRQRSKGRILEKVPRIVRTTRSPRRLRCSSKVLGLTSREEAAAFALTYLRTNSG